LAAYGAEAARALGTLSYSRAIEEAADDGAIEMMRKAGYDPADLGGWLRREGKGGKALKYLKYLSTHPDPEMRARRLDNRP
jgi:predicted Zn-dependent protease